MAQGAKHIRTVYLSLLLCNTLAASLIWGINTLFLLDAGLNNTEAFTVNAFFALGQALFEIPTGVIADLWGRRTSYLLGTLTLGISTLLYVAAWQMHAPLWEWAAISILLGLGFAFFSGATEAWLVDALHATGYKGNLDTVFAHGQIVSGVAVLAGSVGGGLLAQATNLGTPYFLRAGLLLIMAIVAFLFMHDLGFKPQPHASLTFSIKRVFITSVAHGWRNRSIKWTMLAGAFTSGASFYIFYAMQPRLLSLYGNDTAYIVVGLATAAVAASQIAGGFLIPRISKLFAKRTTLLMTAIGVNGMVLLLVGVTDSFWLTLLLLVIWGMSFAAASPVRQAYLNSLIPSDKRATVLSFDSLIGSSGGIATQPILGKVADAFSYPASYMVSAAVSAFALPFIALARRTKSQGDTINRSSLP
jgi:MFS family permease